MNQHTSPQAETPPTAKPREESVRRACTKFLSYDYPETARDVLLRLANFAADAPTDKYGEGELVERLESRVADHLGKEAAVFMPTGKIAQLIALKLWCRRSGCDRVLLHPRSHIEEHEGKAYRLAFGLEPLWATPSERQMRIDDVRTIVEPLGAATIELPLRPLGCVLPSWGELTALSDHFRTQGIPFHADAARIWESAPFYERSVADIAAHFDSLYVSFYKGLGATAGAALAGPEPLVAEARVWAQRFGQRLHQAFPMVVDALYGLEKRLPRMAGFHNHARALAEALSRIDGVRVTPDPPHANAMLVMIDGSQDGLAEAALAVSEETGVWLFNAPVPSPIDGLAMFEITVREASLDVSPEEAAGIVTLLRDRLIEGPAS